MAFALPCCLAKVLGEVDLLVGSVVGTEDKHWLMGVLFGFASRVAAEAIAAAVDTEDIVELVGSG